MLTQGTKVICNGYSGRVVRVCSGNGETTGMVEVRVPGGVTCVSIQELRLPLRIGQQTAKHLYEVETECGKIEVDADNRTQARKLAEARAFEVRSINMVG